VATDDEQSEMTIKKPALRYELNLNTIVQLVGLPCCCGPVGRCRGDLNTGVKALEEQSAKEELECPLSRSMFGKRQPALSHHGR
jgi:hypothetical protein